MGRDREYVGGGRSRELRGEAVRESGEEGRRKEGRRGGAHSLVPQCKTKAQVVLGLYSPQDWGGASPWGGEMTRVS